MPTLSQQIESALATARAKPQSFGEFIDSLSFSGHMLPVLILTGPFVSPLPIPIFSSTAGVFTMVLGFSILMGIKPWIPQKVYDLSLSKKFMVKTLQIIAKLAKVFEKLSMPRLLLISKHPLNYQFNGLVILLCGIIYMVPLPPFAHMPSAAAVAVLAVGDLEDDGLLILLGYILFALNLALLGSMLWFGAEIASALFG